MTIARAEVELKNVQQDLKNVKHTYINLIEAIGKLLDSAEPISPMLRKKFKVMFVSKKEITNVHKALKACGEIRKRMDITAKSARSKGRPKPKPKPVPLLVKSKNRCSSSRSDQWV